MSRVAWLDLSNGVSGDMMLGALVSAGVPLETMSAALAPLGLPISLRAELVDRAGMAATKIHVDAPDNGQTSRTWRDIRDLLQTIDEPVRGMAAGVFSRLARAEAEVHGIPADEVHFHEVGALDAIADVVASCAGLAALELDRIIASTAALGAGSARGAHGTIPVPVPAVLALATAAGMPVAAGEGSGELATPTGIAIVAAFASEYGPLPPMTPRRIGVGAGDHNPPSRPNVVRIVVGEQTGQPNAQAGQALVLEANIDDMDPRGWPAVIAVLIEAGAGDAWLIPIAMKKGRPAHTLCAIVAPDRAADVRAAIFANTTTIGIRETPVAKHTLHREFRSIEVGGQPIAVKLGTLATGEVVNAMPEWEDVVKAAATLGRPVKTVLAEALGLAVRWIG